VDALVYLPDPARAVRRARRAAAEILGQWRFDPESIENAVLVVSEIVTNAIRHCAGQIYLRLSRNDDYVRIEVTDPSPVPPRLIKVGPEAERGRGLFIVSQLATRWGSVPRGTGKTVWADLPYRLAHRDPRRERRRKQGHRDDGGPERRQLTNNC
jgi:anti-sigma regulatory factor (Ser/Thr protein kinase)